LTAYFKSYESRDETIGRGILYINQALSFLESITMFTDTILLWSMAAEETQKQEKESA
jgi:hypothetical protein